MSTAAFLLLGSNQGDAAVHLATAIRLITEQTGPIASASSLYQTSAWGKTDQPDFLNQVITVSFTGSASSLLSLVLGIEKQMGRVRLEKWGARIIDIDILFFGNEILTKPDLQVPHPQIPNRRFTLIPLVEIAPDFIHPQLQQSMMQLLAECTDMLDVQKVSL